MMRKDIFFPLPTALGKREGRGREQQFGTGRPKGLPAGSQTPKQLPTLLSLRGLLTFAPFPTLYFASKCAFRGVERLRESRALCQTRKSRNLPTPLQTDLLLHIYFREGSRLARSSLRCSR